MYILSSTEALVTLARRYCMENYDFWCKEYSEKRMGNDYPYTYTDNDYDLFPRYNVLRAILLEVEILTGSQFSSLSNCRECLTLAGRLGETVFTSGKNNEIERLAMEDERNKFTAYIDNITDDDLRTVEPLPYARHMKDAEAANVRKMLLQYWNFDGGYWEPLVQRSPKPFVFLAKENITKSDAERIKEFVVNLAVGRMYRITEDQIDYQIDKSLFDPDCYETVYCDENYNWIVYGSHEGTVAFGGDQLVAFVRRLYGERMGLIDLMPEIAH